MNPSDAARLVEALTLDVLVLRTRLPAALDHIDQCRGGYPATASGSNTGGMGERTIAELVIDSEGRPVRDAEGNKQWRQIPLDGTLRADPAVAAFERITAELRALSNQAASLARLVSSWHVPSTEAGRHADAATRARLDSLYCQNHLKYGAHEMRAHEHRLCGWCRDVKGRYKVEPDAELVKAKGRALRSLTTGDYAAFVKRVAERKSGKKQVQVVEVEVVEIEQRRTRRLSA